MNFPGRFFQIPWFFQVFGAFSKFHDFSRSGKSFSHFLGFHDFSRGWKPCRNVTSQPSPRCVTFSTLCKIKCTKRFPINPHTNIEKNLSFLICGFPANPKKVIGMIKKLCRTGAQLGLLLFKEHPNNLHWQAQAEIPFHHLEHRFWDSDSNCLSSFWSFAGFHAVQFCARSS